MKKTLITIEKINSTEAWYRAQGTVHGVQIVGYGTTHTKALENAFNLPF